MEVVIASLLHLGIGGAMAAAFIAVAWRLVTREMPAQRADFLAALREQGSMHEASLDDIVDDFVCALHARDDRLDAALRQLADRVDRRHPAPSGNAAAAGHTPA